MNKRTLVDPLQTQLIELTASLSEHAEQLRDYGTTPGNAWLAQGELQAVSQLVGELEVLIEAIKEMESPTD